MSVLILKLLAMATMLIDHIGYRIVGNSVLMRVVGRTAFILYAFLMAESYHHLKDRPDRLREHMKKLLLLCIFSEIPYDLCTSAKLFDFSTQNVIFTLTCGFFALILSDLLIKKLKNRKTAMSFAVTSTCIMLAWLSFLIRADAGFFGVLLIILFYLYVRKAASMAPGKKTMCLAGIYIVYAIVYILTLSASGGWGQILACILNRRWWLLGMMIPFVFIRFYNGCIGWRNRGFNLVYSFFYPVHMVVLFLIWRISL